MAQNKPDTSLQDGAWATLHGVADDTTPLIDGALALATARRQDPALDWHRAHVARLVAELEALGPADGAESAAAKLQQVMAIRFGYRGATDDYDDLQNADLVRVIDRRKGLPVALSILYMHVGRSAGWDLHGLNFPGHFLVRLQHAGDRAILDPFHGGGLRGAVDLRSLLKATVGTGEELGPRHYAAVSDRDVLLRLENNIKVRHLRQGRLDDASASLDRMLTMAPDYAELWREAGLIHARLNNEGAAIQALERYLVLGGDDRLMHEVAILLQQLRQRTP